MSRATDQLAINGGPRAKTVPYGTGRRFAGNELRYLEETLAQNTLFYGFGGMTKRACEAMKQYTGVPFIVPCSSGTAAIHLALIACGVGPGDEVIVTPNTDQGSVIGIIEEGAVPVFCDPDFTLQPTAEAIAARITDRTKAVEVVHLAGYPAPIDEIMALCRSRNIAVIEDCAQSWGTKLHGQIVGTFCDAGCYSINDFKHISAGDGGFVALRDEELFRRVSNYSDKCYDRLFDQTMRQVHHAMNYRMTELQSAVALAQLERVNGITSRQHDRGEQLLDRLRDLPGAKMVAPIPGGYSTYWWTAMFVDPRRFSVDREVLVEAMQAEGIKAESSGGYDLIGTPLFQTRVVRPWLNDGRKRYPFTQPDGHEYRYSHEATPRHRRMLDTGIHFGMNTFFTEQDIDETALGVRKVLEAYAG